MLVSLATKKHLQLILCHCFNSSKINRVNPLVKKQARKQTNLKHFWMRVCMSVWILFIQGDKQMVGVVIASLCFSDYSVLPNQEARPETLITRLALSYRLCFLLQHLHWEMTLSKSNFIICIESFWYLGEHITQCSLLWLTSCDAIWCNSG